MRDKSISFIKAKVLDDSKNHRWSVGTRSVDTEASDSFVSQLFCSRYLIKTLLEKWCYDFNTLLLDESSIDFNGNTVSRPTYNTLNPIYGPPNHIPPNIISQYPEPIHIPKPPHVPYITNEIGKFLGFQKFSHSILNSFR